MNLNDKEPKYQSIEYSDIYKNDLALTFVIDVLRLESVKQKTNNNIDLSIEYVLQAKSLLKELHNDFKLMRNRRDELVIQLMQLKRQNKELEKINNNLMAKI